MLGKDAYQGREQTYVKHFVLENYLDRLAFKIGYSGCTLNYIDGFAGPWQERDDALRDTSPFIAMSNLAKARQDLSDAGGGPFTVRCLFIERDRVSSDRLRQAVQQQTPEGIEAVEVINGELETLADRAAEFARQGTKPFGFVFLDPTGWKGISLEGIRPLLRLEYGEVLVNFMTQRISRFVDLSNAQDEEEFQSFSELFGGPGYRDQWQDLTGLDREDAIMSTYLTRLKRAGFSSPPAPWSYTAPLTVHTFT